MRLLEDYLVVPRVLGDAVGLTPLVVLVSVTSVGILFGGFAVILAIPIAAGSRRSSMSSSATAIRPKRTFPPSSSRRGTCET